MANKSVLFLFLLVFIFGVCLSSSGVYAFGAGNIPSFAYLEGKAFRHGDIEDALAELLKRGSGGGFALASLISKGSKFGGLDIKRVYFGNWLRDYSQAVDIGSLKKLPVQTIINLCMVLGFLAHGYATHEFEVTEERLGVYLPTEHIDNPKGYGEGEDARKYNPKLRGPVDPRELEIDPRTGMKNYIANESGNWDTSKALVRRTLERCIHLGRQHRSQGRKEDEYEAYRLLGQALHTLEDFPAHSNFCELSLVSMGHQDIFVHVGDQARIQAPGGKRVAPIVTGTFGGSDFIHSLLGEATDHLSQASVSDLNKELDKARSTSSRSPSSSTLRGLFSSIPGGTGGEMSRELDGIERIREGPAQGGKRPEDMNPQELHAVLWQILTFRDSVVKKIEKTIEKIPGLGPLIEKLMDSISVFVFTTLEPFVKPLLKTATTGLQGISGEVIDNKDQYEVFNDPRASDPTHSFLSKDHFNLILNEPAGHLARIVVIHAVTLITKAWDDNSVNVHGVTEDILGSFFHPDFHDSSSKIQREMLQYMRSWVQGLGGKQHATLQRLTKDAVRNHQNIRLAGDGGVSAAEGTYAYNQGQHVQHEVTSYVQGLPGVSQVQNILGSGGHGNRKEMPDSLNAGYPGAAANSGHNHGQPPPAFPPNASSFSGNSAGSTYTSQGQPSPSFLSNNAPSFPGGPGGSAYTAPTGPPPSFPGGGSGGSPYMPPTGAPPTNYSSYSPSYNTPPSFPGEEHQHHPHHHHGHHAPSSGYGPPSDGYGTSPGFPGAGPNFPGAAPEFPGSPPQFPGAPQFPGGPSGPQFPDAAPEFPGSGPGFPQYNAPPHFPEGGSGYPGSSYRGSGY